MKRRILFIGIALTIFLSTQTAALSFLTGNKLDEYCASEDYFTDGYCTGYIVGIFDAHDYYVDIGSIPKLICVPKGATVAQVRKVVMKYINENPKYLHDVGGSIVLNAYHEAFPCH